MTMLQQEWRNPKLYNPTPISDSATQPDFGRKGSAKAYLHCMCSAKHWKQPLFECYNEEGPPHSKLFSLKVSIQSDKGCVIVECFDNTKTSKQRMQQRGRSEDGERNFADPELESLLSYLFRYTISFSSSPKLLC
ncbi:non-specific serine/threonine protein kinase [Salvia divinorum]|uniref:Non-specific serine/threonine protein kinase n=1 Tax=Salvia divinorum TaxID=28513 RepID=A0ABD1IAV5_SALDI